MALTESIPFNGLDTVPKLFMDRVANFSQKVAVREKEFGIWNEYTWNDWGANAREIGLGLKALGLVRSDVVSIASEINKEWLFTDLGIVCIGGICNGVYSTDSTEQVEYLINDSGSKFYFAENEEQLDKVLQVRENAPTLEKIIIFDMEGLRDLDDEMCMSIEQLRELGRTYDETHPSEWSNEVQKASPEDVIILTYTSGTTGRPKGAMITHRNMIFMMTCIQNCLSVYPTDRQLGFLPLAHIAGRMFYVYSVIEARSIVHLIEDPDTMVNDICEVEPTVHFAVPRVWEKQHSLVTLKLKKSTKFARNTYDFALKIGYARAERILFNRQVSIFLEVLFKVCDFLVFRNIKRALGLDKCRWLSTAAAPIAPELIRWYWALGIPMYELYGQTECTGIATCNVESRRRLGSVGPAAEGIDVTLSAENEILIRSPGVIKGYWKRPEQTADTIRQEWLYTGDIGRIDDDGFVYVVDRMKDIIITAGGKNITPSEIENHLKFSPYITDAVVIGDRRPYLTCMIMIDHDNVTQYAQEQDVPFTNYESLCHTDEVLDLIAGEVERVNQRFAQVETIKKFRLIDQLLDAEDEELTPTQKLKRSVISRKYASVIDEMYESVN